MPDETVGAAVAEAAPVESPPETPVSEAEAPVEAPAPEAEGGEETKQEPVSWDSIVDNFPEDQKAAWEVKQTELVEEGRRKMQSEWQPKWEKVNRTFQGYLQNSQYIRNALGEIVGTIQEAHKEGTLDGQMLARVFNAAPQAFQALTDLTGSGGWYDAARWAASQASTDIGGENGAKFMGEYITRWNGAQGGAESFEDVWKDMNTARDEALKEKWTAPLKNRIKALETQMEKGKAEARSGGGPSPSGGRGSGGGKTYSTETDIKAALGRGEISVFEARQLLGRRR